MVKAGAPLRHIFIKLFVSIFLVFCRAPFVFGESKARNRYGSVHLDWEGALAPFPKA